MKIIACPVPLDYEGLGLGGGKRASLCCFLPSDFREFSEGRRRPAILVIPGGGYSYCSEREAEPVALQYVAEDLAAFILDYSVGPDAGFPRCLYEALAAIRLIRANAEEWKIDPGKIAAIGFSAGGHLAASVGAFWNADFVRSALGETEELRPNALILSYPVISTDPAIRHPGSVKNLLGEDPDPAALEACSIERQVTESYPPTFLWHTATDASVPVENSLVMAKALAAKKIRFEMHIYPTGSHGLALSDERTAKLGEDGKPLLRHLEPRPREWMRESILFLKHSVFEDGVK